MWHTVIVVGHGIEIRSVLRCLRLLTSHLPAVAAAVEPLHGTQVGGRGLSFKPETCEPVSKWDEWGHVRDGLGPSFNLAPLVSFVWDPCPLVRPGIYAVARNPSNKGYSIDHGR